MNFSAHACARLTMVSEPLICIEFLFDLLQPAIARSVKRIRAFRDIAFIVAASFVRDGCAPRFGCRASLKFS
jgi:hypothetical protein